MLKDVPDASKASEAPITPQSSLANALIRTRELILNRLAGASASLVVNDQKVSRPQSVASELAVRLRTTLMDLKRAYMDPQSARVHYAALRQSSAYAAYRRNDLAALRHFDPHVLPSGEAARAFWINLYNALVLDAVIYFDVQASVTEGLIGVLSFFRRAAYRVGGQRVSLEDIEHGILRGNRGNPFVPGAHFPSDDPRLAWSLPIDPRLHFALNCGARACPPIRAYAPEQLDQQLTLATRAFLDGTVSVHPQRNEIILPKLLSWFKNDFGGHAGVVRFLIDHLPDDARRQLLLQGGELRITYCPYDWRLNHL